MKKICSIIMAMCLGVGMLAGCGETQGEEKNATNNSEEQKEVEDVQEVVFSGYSFEIPGEWSEGDSSEDLLYFYPETGMLMIQFSPMEGESILDEAVQQEFSQGFSSAYENFELVEQSTIQVADGEAYQQVMNLTNNDTDYQSTMVTFDCQGGWLTIALFAVKGEDTYSQEFDEILASIKNESGEKSASYAVNIKDLEFQVPGEWVETEIAPNESEENVKCFESDEIYLKVIYGEHALDKLDDEQYKAYIGGVGTRLGNFELDSISEGVFNGNKAKIANVYFTANNQDYIGSIYTLEMANFIFGTNTDDEKNNLNIKNVLESVKKVEYQNSDDNSDTLTDTQNEASGEHEDSAQQETTNETENKKQIYSLEHGTLLDVNYAGGSDGNTLVIKAKIEPNMTNKLTIDQNYYNIEDIVVNQGGSDYESIQYWAVADMESGDEGKVISFTVNHELIEKIKNEEVVANHLGDYVDDLWILPSLTE